MRGHKVSLVDLIRDGEGNGCRPSHSRGKREEGDEKRKKRRNRRERKEDQLIRNSSTGGYNRVPLGPLAPVFWPPARKDSRSRLSINLRFEGRRPASNA